jgi:hypothetical protein
MFGISVSGAFGRRRLPSLTMLRFHIPLIKTGSARGDARKGVPDRDRVRSGEAQNCFGAGGPMRKILAAGPSLQVASRHPFAYHRKELLGWWR